jgi:hypothetical protein
MRVALVKLLWGSTNMVALQIIAFNCHVERPASSSERSAVLPILCPLLILRRAWRL